ncbi:MAG: hypothetical protein ACM3VW_01625 [Bacteroidota bacterium]
MTPTEAQTEVPKPSYTELLQELQPRMMIEVTEENLNNYLRNHPELYDMPEGFTAPYVSFADGAIEVSALAKVLFVSTRVRVSMIPEVSHGRLRLRVHRIHAGPIPLPASFHHGAADTIAGVVNEFLTQNHVQLVSVCAAPKVIRVTGQGAPTEEPAAEAQ